MTSGVSVEQEPEQVPGGEFGSSINTNYRNNTVCTTNLCPHGPLQKS